MINIEDWHSPNKLLAYTTHYNQQEYNMPNSNNKLLSIKDQILGQNRYFKFTFCNGFSVICLSDSILMLYVIKNGGSDIMIAYMASFIYIANLFMLLGRKSIAKIGAVKTIARGWHFRYIFAILMLIAPLLPPQYKNLSLASIIIGSLGFFCGTSYGTVALQSYTGEITASGGKGLFTSKLFMKFSIANLIALSLVVSLIHLIPGLLPFQIIIISAICVGLIGTHIISNAKETQTPKLSAQEPIAHGLRSLWQNLRSRRLLLTWTTCYFGIMLVIPFSMIILKKGFFISDNIAILFIFIQLLGCLCASFFSSLVSEETGPRPLIIIYFSFLIIISFIWLISPDHFSPAFAAIAFFLCGIVAIGMQISLYHYFLLAIPQESRVSNGLLLNVAAGLVAGLLGSFVSSSIISILSHIIDNPINVYRTYFAIIMIILSFAILIVKNLEQLSGWNVTDVIGLALAPREMMTFYTLKKINDRNNLDFEYDNIKTLERTNSHLSEKSLLSFLNSPQFLVRIRALEALREIKNLSNNAIEKIQAELVNGKYATAYMAAVILGEHNIKEAIPALREAIHSDDVFLAGKAIIALATLNDSPSYEQIRQIFKKSKNPRLIIHCANALAKTRDKRFLRSALEKSIQPGLDIAVRHEIINSMAVFLGHARWTYKFLKYYRTNTQTGIEFLTELLENCTTYPKDLLIAQVNDFFQQKTSTEQMIIFLHETRPSNDNSQEMQETLKFLSEVDPTRVFPELIYCMIIRIYLPPSLKIKTLT
ncbi:MAG: hypothetical protein ACRC37_00995 [Lentisphaeria bacterium]